MILLVVGWWFFTRPQATCFDGVQNQGELGVDCGGECEAVCQDLTQNPGVEWSRVFMLDDSRYTTVGLVNNPNTDYRNNMIDYTFTLFDKNGVTLKEVSGSTRIGAGQTLPIVESGITLDRPAARSTLELEVKEEWERVRDPRLVEEDIRTQELQSFNLDTAPRIEAVVQNRSIYDLRDISFAALIYDENENLVHASSTFLEQFNKDRNRTLTFTWPAPFTDLTRQCSRPTSTILIEASPKDSNLEGVTELVNSLSDVVEDSARFSHITYDGQSAFDATNKDMVRTLGTYEEFPNLLSSLIGQSSSVPVFIVFQDSVMDIEDLLAVAQGRDNLFLVPLVSGLSEEYTDDQNVLPPNSEELVSVYKDQTLYECRAEPAVIDIVMQDYTIDL